MLAKAVAWNMLEMHGKIPAMSGLFATLLQAPFCPFSNFLVTSHAEKEVIRQLERGEEPCLQTRFLCLPAATHARFKTGSSCKVTECCTASLQHLGQMGWKTGKEAKTCKEKSTIVTQNRFFECQMYVHRKKVKVIPGAPYCYSYNSVLEFQQTWVSVLIQRQNKLKGSESKSQ